MNNILKYPNGLSSKDKIICYLKPKKYINSLIRESLDGILPRYFSIERKLNINNDQMFLEVSEQDVENNSYTTVYKTGKIEKYDLRNPLLYLLNQVTNKYREEITEQSAYAILSREGLDRVLKRKENNEK